MTLQDESYTRSASTTGMCEGCLLRGPRPPHTSVGAKRPPLRFYSRRDVRKPLTVTVAYSGGAEGTWTVKARGQTWRVCGHVAATDVFTWLSGSYYGK